jgi:hypothetical protein
MSRRNRHPVRRVTGAVEQFKPDRVSGWIDVPVGAPAARVGLHVNDLEVAATWTAEPGPRNGRGEARPFRFWLHDLWDYVGPEDELVVIHDGHPVPVARHGMFVRPPEQGPANPEALAAKLATGYLFGQKGELQLSKKLDVEWQRQVLALFGRVRALLQAWHGYEPFFVYGTLLGVVREDGFIGHDLDFDSAYISACTDGSSAASELRDIAIALIEEGFEVGSSLSHLHITDDTGTRIDLFHLYFDPDGKLCWPFGIAGTGAIARDEWEGVTERPFSAGTAVLPVNAERVVEHMYGADWRQPKPGFMWYLDRTDRAPEGIMPADMVAEIHWADFYTRTGFDAPSSFFAKVAARPDLPSTVIDLGCGDGRDAWAFAAGGRTVLGLDRAATAIRAARRRTDDLAAPPRLEVCDLGDSAAVQAELAGARASADGPMLFYLRFLLHAVSEATQRALLRSIADATRPGDLLAAEFRTPADEERPKTYPDHPRRYQDGVAFAQTLADLGFEVVDEEQGIGLAPLGDEDPELYRAVARRG